MNGHKYRVLNTFDFNVNLGFNELILNTKIKRNYLALVEMHHSYFNIDEEMI